MWSTPWGRPGNFGEYGQYPRGGGAYGQSPARFGQSEPQVYGRRTTIYPNQQNTSTSPSIDIPLQRSYSGAGCISNLLANQSCASIGVPQMLEELNFIMGTTYPLSKDLSVHLQACITRGEDFGMAYSHLRPQWHLDFATLEKRMKDAEAKEAQARRDAIDASGKLITNAKLPPRRVWDLYSNRVIPRWWIREHRQGILVVPVSHAWVAEDERSGVQTPINGHQWPVPIPLDSSLDQVRVELLNLKLEYAWLDVLCLRQRGKDDDEEMRAEEWKLDVPTIGYVYRQSAWDDRVVVYFNGLGRPFRILNVDGPRHWLNRAWTVQEAGQDMIVGGQTPSSPNVSMRDNNEPYHKFYNRLDRAKRLTGIQIFTVSEALEIMGDRSAVSELDKIAGLVTLFHSQSIPTYDEKQSAEDAWAAVIEVMSAVSRAHLLFWYPSAGNARYSWAPSWSQIVSERVPPAEVGILDLSRLNLDATENLYEGIVQTFEDCLVLGLGSDDDKGDTKPRRKGSIVVKDKGGILRHCEIVAHHRILLDDSVRYKLLLSRDYGLAVVGIQDSGRRFRKICSVIVTNPQDYGAMASFSRTEEIYFN